jgi:hypothetical protein
MKNLQKIYIFIALLSILSNSIGQTVDYEPLITESQIINREIQQDLIVGKTTTNQTVSAT